MEGLGGDPTGLHVHRAVRPEVEAGDATEGGGVLVLLADRASKPLDLDLAGLAGEVRRADVVALRGVHGLEQADGEGAGGAEPGAGGGGCGAAAPPAGAAVVGG